jgi:hypothetical protein
MVKAFCAPVSLSAFIRFRPYPNQESVAKNSSFKRSSLRGTGQGLAAAKRFVAQHFNESPYSRQSKRLVLAIVFASKLAPFEAGEYSPS